MTKLNKSGIVEDEVIVIVKSCSIKNIRESSRFLIEAVMKSIFVHICCISTWKQILRTNIYLFF